MTKASDNAFPSLLITEGTEPSAPAAGKQRLYIDSTSHKLKRTDSSGTDVTIESGAGFSFTWSSGTSMPGSPATNDRITRTDLNLDFYYNGTRWLTTTLYHVDIGGSTEALSPVTASANSGTYLALWAGDRDIWIETWYATTNVLTTNNGTNFWTCTLADADGTSLGSFSTGTGPDAASTRINHKTTVNALLGTAFTTASAYVATSSAKTLSPGALYLISSLTYRLVGT